MCIYGFIVVPHTQRTQRASERRRERELSEIYVNNYVYCIIVIDKKQKVLHSRTHTLRHTQRKFIAKTKQV